MRMSSANAYEKSLQILYARQSELAGQQEKLTSGKNINRPSDDPSSAAQAERAQTRLSRIASDRQALEVQRGALTLAESALGDSAGLLQRFRELTITAGNGGYNAADRLTIAKEMGGLREQLLSLANAEDGNGLPLFGGLGSASAPFVEGASGVVFNGLAGQQASTETSVPGTMDGQAVWMNVASGNGSFALSTGASNTGSLWSNTGQVLTPASLTGHNYTITFSVVGAATTYSVQDTTNIPPTTVLPAPAIPPAANPSYTPGQAISFDGLSLVANGVPANGDTVQVVPSTTTSLFKVMDDAITAIADTNLTSSQRAQAVGLALTQVDNGMNRLQAARSQAGEWLNRADNIQHAQEGRALLFEADKSRAQDLDMVKGISDFTRLQTGYQAALQSYAQVQKLSLFNFIN
ncbi:MAG: flagellar hook-associated protein FlgL [Burkholderiales bacterium]|nr:flagellar hook-associated protein FlgL [Burkholderiales bacterium]